MNARTKKFFQYVLPSVLASCSSFLYTIVDGIFVGQGVGTEGLGAVNLAMPYVMIIMALGMLMTIGGITMTAIFLGEKDEEAANNVFRHSLSASAGIGVLLMIFGMVFSRQIASICGANGTFLQMTAEYIFYYSMFSLPFLMSVCMQGVLRFGRFRPDARIWGEALTRGLPEMITHFGTPITTLCMNRMLLLTLGDMAIPAFSVISYVMSFATGLFIGVSEGVQPLFGQSYGARETDNLKYYFRAGLRVNGIASIVIYVLVSLFGRAICALFNPDPQLADIAAAALPRFAWSFLFISLNLMISAYLYSTKRTLQAVIIAVFRCIILNTVCILVLSALFGGVIVWFTPGIVETIAFIIAFALWKYSERDGIVFV